MHDETDEAPRWFTPFARFVPLFALVAVIATLVLVPLKIVQLGFMPSDDALRHVAKVLSGKSWSDILVLRPEIQIDHNAGWHQFLGLVRSATGWGAEGLVLFSVVALCLLYLLAPLGFLRRPESWALAFLAAMVVHPHTIYRISLGRPYILVMACVMAVLLLWLRNAPEKERLPRRLLLATTLLMSVSIYVHGGWYLYWLPAAGFLAAQRWKQGLALAACWAAASLLAGLYSGHPVFFLEQQFRVLTSCFGQPVLQRMLVVEFQPFDGAWGFVVLAALVLLARRGPREDATSAWRDPALMMAVVCWVLGFAVRRFWTDWGTPALLVWLAREADMALRRVGEHSVTRVILTALACAALYFAATSDYENRWTSGLTKERLEAAREDPKGWMPEPGGIVYNDDRRVFYSTFYANPSAPWRYILGFESTFMPPEDLAVLHRVEWNHGAYEALEPWVRKMTPADRMILRRPGTMAPPIEELEWYYAATETWIGRKKPSR